MKAAIVLAILSLSCFVYAAKLELSRIADTLEIQSKVMVLQSCRTDSECQSACEALKLERCDEVLGEVQ